MTTENLSNLLLHYGRLTTDIEIKEDNGYVRIRTYSYNGKQFYHHMYNGTLVECFELKQEE